MAMPRRPQQSADFVAGRAGALFEVRTIPHDDVDTHAAVVMVPPIGEEMNRSRRLLAAVRHSIALRGHTAVLVDPFGSGDSAGTLEQADWCLWTDDLADTIERVRDAGVTELALLGVRSGALVLNDALTSRHARVDRVVLLQPELQGRLVLRRAIRARLASGRVYGTSTDTEAGLRGRWARGETIELGGYVLSPTLASGIESAVCDPHALSLHAGTVTVLHSGRPDDATDTDPQAAVGFRAIDMRPFWQLHDLPVEQDAVETVCDACTGAPTAEHRFR